MTPEEVDALEASLDTLFFFALVWSVACTVDYEGRIKFDQFIRSLMAESRSKVALPKEGSIYD